jgi:hypothetical protein
LTASIGFVLACVLLAGLPAAASAAAPEMRGEWEIVVNSSGQTLKGKTLITQEANVKEEFASPTHAVHFEDGGTGSFLGTLEGSTATVTVITDPIGPFPVGEFNSSTMTVTTGVNSLVLSGPGTITVSGNKTSATLTATRLKSQKQIEEQEAQEKLEREEMEAKERVRGEWSLTFESGPEVVKGVSLITQAANAKEEFASSSALFESAIPGTFDGTIEGNEASVTITTQAAGPFPAGTFTGTKLVVSVTSSSMSIVGPGTLSSGGNSLPATLTATRTKTYAEVVAREAKEREAKEKQEREAREAKEKTEREAAEKTAREAKEKQEKEALLAKEKAIREAKEKQEREAREAIAKTPVAKAAALVSATLTGKTFTVSTGGLLSLQIANPNAYAISGRLTVVLSGQAGKSSASKGGTSKKAVALGSASFTISPSGKQLVKLKLSQKGRTELAHHKTLHVVLTLTTQASGQTSSTKTLNLTLRAAKAAHNKH